ncbi:MAG: VWA domain-containing protein [Acidobacteriota bacterium]
MPPQTLQVSPIIFFAAIGLSSMSSGATELQEASPGQNLPGTIRVDVTFVPVPVIVLDQNGRPVADLSKDDFRVAEDGVPQDILSFSVCDLEKKTGGPGPDRLRVEVKPATGGQPAAPNHRKFVLLLGRGFHERYFDTITHLIEFVREGLGPSDQVAVMAYGRASNFTLDHEAVARLLERYAAASPEIEQAVELRARGLGAVYGIKQLTPKLQAQVDSIFDTPGIGSKEAVTVGKTELERQSSAVDREVLENEERAALDADHSADIFAADTTLRQTHLDDLTLASALKTHPRISSTYFDQLKSGFITDLPFEDYIALRGSTSQDVQNIFAAIEYLRYLEGEKHLLFLTEHGLVLPHLEGDGSIARVASDAGVRIHCLQTGGVFDSGREADNRRVVFKGPGVYRKLAGIDSPSFTRFFGLTSLHQISRMTGGLAFVHSDISQSLRTVRETSGMIYYLAYRPKNPTFDGKYRTIEVRVRRDGTRVIARGGYYARPLTVPYDHEKFVTYARTVAAANYADPISDIRVDAKVSKKRIGDGKLQVTADIKVGTDPEFFVSENGRQKARLSVNCFLVKDDEEILAQSWDTLDLNLKEETYRNVLRDGIPISEAYEVPGKGHRARLKIIVYDAKTDKLGSIVRRVW